MFTDHKKAKMPCLPELYPITFWNRFRNIFTFSQLYIWQICRTCRGRGSIETYLRCVLYITRYNTAYHSNIPIPPKHHQRQYSLLTQQRILLTIVLWLYDLYLRFVLNLCSFMSLGFSFLRQLYMWSIVY